MFRNHPELANASAKELLSSAHGMHFVQLFVFLDSPHPSLPSNIPDFCDICTAPNLHDSGTTGLNSAGEPDDGDDAACGHCCGPAAVPAILPASHACTAPWFAAVRVVLRRLFVPVRELAAAGEARAGGERRAMGSEAPGGVFKGTVLGKHRGGEPSTSVRVLLATNAISLSRSRFGSGLRISIRHMITYIPIYIIHQELMRAKNPQGVISRFERGKYTHDEECWQHYVAALAQVGHAEKILPRILQRLEQGGANGWGSGGTGGAAAGETG
ncbi:hypothetical protein BC936DRAFT_143617, partial [Jimgerdemannia flammicorona]